MAGVTLVLRDATEHAVVYRRGYFADHWFCKRCWTRFTGRDPRCPNEILGAVPWTG